jgi:hypothetical protein
MESRVMSNVLQVDFLGLLHINADGIVAIAAAVLIVIGLSCKKATNTTPSKAPGRLRL